MFRNISDDSNPNNIKEIFYFVFQISFTFELLLIQHCIVSSDSEREKNDNLLCFKQGKENDSINIVHQYPCQRCTAENCRIL
jgi:hypothetical protein